MEAFQQIQSDKEHMKTFTVRNNSAMCLTLLERKKEGNIKKDKNEVQVRVSKIQKWN